MKAQFIGTLSISEVEVGWWSVDEWLRFYSARYDCTTAIQPGFIYDGVSRPIFSRPTKASLVHDFHYRNPFLTRIQADLMFNEAMKAEGRFMPVRWIKTGVLFGVGWMSHKDSPGSVDYRVCRGCQWQAQAPDNCSRYECSNYYPAWEGLFKPGFWPDLGET